MYKFIQKNQKKFLAVFGVLLMIVFILPSSFKNNLSRGDLTIGTVDGEKITGNELGRARSDLDLLRQLEFPPLAELGAGPDPRGGVAAKYFHGDDGALAYLLLQKEAEKQGFSVSTAAADSVVAATYKNTPLSEDQHDQLIPAVARFMLVQAAFDRASQSVKASKPMVQYFMAQTYQGSKLNLVEYSADELEKTVPAPTPEQVRQQYDKYGGEFPGRASFLTTQPATPGYKVADRVKLQFLELPRTAVIDSVLNELSPDDLWKLDVEGFRYYDKHPAEFPVPPPPATRPVFGPTLPSTLPTTKPFADVKADLRKRLLTDPALSSADLVVDLRSRVTAREKQLRTALHDQLAHAYAEWSAAHAGDSSATQPSLPTTNAVVAIYPDLDFLTAFANTFEAQYKVRPLVNSLANKWLTQEDLYSAPDISSAKNGETSFADYAMHDLNPVPTTAPATQGSTDPTTAPTTTAPTTTALATTAPTTSPTETVSVTSWHPIGTGLRPFEPSDLLEDTAGNTFVFRLSAFEPAHKPPLDEVEALIVKQLRSATAYQLARDQAAKLLANARIEANLRKEQKLADQQGLPAAAKASGRAVIEAGPFQARGLLRTRNVPGYKPADSMDNFTFIMAVAGLANQVTPDNLHPSTLIDLPAERKVLVAEMGDTVLPFPAEEMYLADQAIPPIARYALQTGQFIGQQSAPASSLFQDWFDLNNVMARVKYVKSKGA